MHRSPRASLLILGLLALAAGGASAQNVERVLPSVLREVMPAADRFDPADGSPPVKRAYRGDELIGYVFHTEDLPPEQTGYSGAVRAVVGMTLDGVLTGMRVTEYRESRKFEWGDFLAEPGFQEQFTGKPAGDPFGVHQDIDGISQVTITVRALARSVRDAARRVALAYLSPPERPLVEVSDAELTGLSWYEIRRLGAAVTMQLRQEGRNPIDITLIHASSEALLRHLVGERYEALAEDIAEAGGADQVVLYAAEGGGFVPALRSGWSVDQDGRTVAIPKDRVVVLGSSRGALASESSQVGALLLDEQVDITRPLTFAFDRDRPDLGGARVEYTSRAALVRIAEAAPVRQGADEPAAEVRATDPVTLDAPGPEASPEPSVSARPSGGAPAIGAADAPDTAAALEPVAEADAPAMAAEAASAASAEPPVPAEARTGPAFAPPDDERGFEAEAAGLPWSRLGWITLVITLACLAFFTKNASLRWLSLGTTMIALGWIDGGFLSISHVTGLIWVGASAVRSDLPLLILVTFTVGTVLLWGRVFCGFLCPFGALQDFIDRLVPRRLKRELPDGVHRLAWKAKYVILAAILIPAVAGLQVSLYQYFEPFGTVFFLNTNVLLWVIAGSILVASAVVPRLYCRYVCPLGALLGIGSLISLRRIPRVEQCGHCHVCEQKCPTGAIRGPKIDFVECVRCNVCEIQLREKRGVCRHSMDEIRPRLVQLERRKAVARR